MLISTTYGNENFQHNSAKYHLFACRSTLHPDVEPMQKHMWVAARDHSAGVSAHGRGSTVPAAPGYRSEFGKWTTAQFDVPEGLVIKLFGTRKLREMVSGRHTTAAMMLRIRENAALVRVTCGLTMDERASSNNVVLFEGRADPLLASMAESEGVILGNFRSQFSSYNQRALFTVEVLRDEISTPQVNEVTEIENTQGERVQVTTPRRRRAIQL